MANGNKRPPFPENEPVLQYAPGSPERAELKAALDEMMGTRADIPLYIGGEEVRTGDKGEVHPPHDHRHLLGHYHQAGPGHAQQAIDAARAAWPAWSEMAWEARAAVFLRAADLLAGPYRARMNAATMLGQSKNCFQAEIDAACELIDFWRFNAWYLYQLYEEQPESAPGMWNSMEHRPLEGFVFAVSPFNFSSIGGNLPTAPALMGNTVVWKPAATAVYSAAVVMEILHEAGLPAGVVNCIAGPSAPIGKACLESPDLAGVHFTGSTRVFQMMWKEIGNNIDRYRSYPRIVGETGGKDFIFAHPTADVPSLVTALVRGAFEYQGQKCSAASRAFIPASLWDEVVGKVVETTNGLPQGSPLDFRNFLCAVIDKSAYDSIMGYVQHAHESDDHTVLAGGEGDDSEGYYVRPTVVEAKSARSKLMVEEIFGPVLTLYRYEDDEIEQALTDCDEASPYGLTGAIFARDRGAIEHMATRLRHAAGNFYINDKPTGAVVGQQPFGGGRASGTNDKAGSVLNLLRWVSPRAIKETFDPPTDHRYPHMDEE